MRKLIIIKQHLSKEWQEIYKDLLGSDKESTFEPRYSGEITSWIGPTAPKRSGDLSAMSIDQLVEYLVNWRPPSNSFGEPSRMGLAREMGEAIKTNPSLYSKYALKFNVDALHPVYLYQYFIGLRESLKTDQRIEWEPVIKLMEIIVEKGKKNELPIFDQKEEDWNTDWDNVLQHMADLLENGLSSPKEILPFSLRLNVWNIIEFISKNKEPDLEHEKKYGGDNMDYYTLSINTARGEAFHAVFQYVFWCDRNDKQKSGDRIPLEVKKVLEAHLDTEKEPGFTIRSVYGRFFPWVYIYNKEWTKTIMPKLFPLDDLPRRYAAWEMYLINSIYPEIFEDLRPQYEKAIQELKKTSLKKKRHDSDPHERLINHLMIACAYSVIEYDDPLLKNFYKEANKEQLGVGVNFMGRIYIASENATRDNNPDKEKIKAFWELRLKDSEIAEELMQFGWWIKEGYFDDRWMLEKLLETLKKTKGIIDPTYRVLETLKKLALKYPLLVSECLLRIVKARRQDQFLRMTIEDDTKNIVEQLHNHEDLQVHKNILQVCDQMLRLGNNEFRIYMANKPKKFEYNPDKI